MTTTKQELTITAHIRLDGFDFELCFNGQLEQLPALAKRIRELGGEPTANVTAPLSGDRKPAKRVQPAYDGDGQPICSVHRKPLVEGKFGLYCPSRAEGEHANAKGYCNLKFEEA